MHYQILLIIFRNWLYHVMFTIMRQEKLKESFLLPSAALYPKFARLTAQEEKYVLLDDASVIGTRDGWCRRLAERGFAFRGHRLVRST